MKTISKTFRLLPEDIKAITVFSRQRKLSLSRSVQEMIAMAKKYRRQQQLETELQDLSEDKKWLRDNKAWADLDLS
jgi:uncharacterized protein YeeX (DUF496 family)